MDENRFCSLLKGYLTDPDYAVVVGDISPRSFVVLLPDGDSFLISVTKGVKQENDNGQTRSN